MGNPLAVDPRLHSVRRFLNRNYSGYLVPTRADIPELDILFVGEFDEEASPLGAKALGNLTAVSVAPAMQMPFITRPASGCATYRSRWKNCFERTTGNRLFSSRVVSHPERQPLAILDQIRRRIGEYNFAGQYQQAPTPLGRRMIKEAWFRSYAANERPEPFDRIVQSCDTANEAS